jgi:hypothetical protein
MPITAITAIVFAMAAINADKPQGARPDFQDVVMW